MSFCVTGLYWEPGSDGSGKVMPAMADQREEEEVDRAPQGCRTTIDHKVDKDPW